MVADAAGPDWTPLADWLRGSCGMVVDPSRHYLLEHRCQELLVQRKLTNPGDLAREAGRDPQLAQQVFNAVAINESYFFRDSALWGDLATRILPELAREAAYRRSIQVLMCPCSHGQEIWSLTMTAAEAPQVGIPLGITAADLDTEALTAARTGRYSDLETSRGLTPGHLARHFTRLGEFWQVKPELQRGVTFQHLNLTTDFTFPERFDLVFCRNVLIYFDLPQRKRIVDRLAQFTNNYGYLILGGAENLLGVTDTWNARRIGNSTLYQKRY